MSNEVLIYLDLFLKGERLEMLRIFYLYSPIKE